MWQQIAQFNLPEPLTHEDRSRLTELVSRARRIAWSRRTNYQYGMAEWAKTLNIRPQRPVYLVDGFSDFCRPFLAPA